MSIRYAEGGIDHTTMQVDHRADVNQPAEILCSPATTAGEAHANSRRSHAGHSGHVRSSGDHDHSDGC